MSIAPEIEQFVLEQVLAAARISASYTRDKVADSHSTLLRPATVVGTDPESGDTQVLVDGDDNAITAQSLGVEVHDGDRVLIIFQKPSGVFILAIFTDTTGGGGSTKDALQDAAIAALQARIDEIGAGLELADLPTAGTLTGAELVLLLQDGDPKKLPINQLGGGAGGTYRQVNNVDATLTASDRVVGVANVSAQRTITLPHADAVPSGAAFLVFDETGTVDSTQQVVIVADTAHGDAMFNGISGFFGVLQQPHAWHVFVSNGDDNWYIQEASPGSGSSYTDTQLAAGPTVPLGAAAVRITSITTNRIVTLPPAAQVAPGQRILIFDVSGSCSPSKQIRISPSGSDTMTPNAFGWAILQRPYSWTQVVSDGASGWFTAELSADPDPDMTANTDQFLPTQKAAKAYVDKGGTRQTFSNTNVTVAAGTRSLAHTGNALTLTASRTVTLPAANSVVNGFELTVQDESGSCGPANADPTQGWHLFIVPVGSDVIRSPVRTSADTTEDIFHPFDRRTLRSNGNNAWVVTDPGVHRPVIWYAHSRAVAIPSGVWTPLPWDTVFIDSGNMHPGYTASATITGANLPLPATTITVDSTAGFLNSGWGEAVDTLFTGAGTVFHYTSKNATQFLGCNAAPYANIATGTLVAGMTVEQAYVATTRRVPHLYAEIYGASFSKNAVGIRRIRTSAELDVGFGPQRLSFADGTDSPALWVDNQRVQMAMQPAGGFLLDPDTSINGYVELYQDSGETIYSTQDGFTTPIIMAFNATGA